jgi:hypothetical protein
VLLFRIIDSHQLPWNNGLELVELGDVQARPHPTGCRLPHGHTQRCGRCSLSPEFVRLRHEIRDRLHDEVTDA